MCAVVLHFDFSVCTVRCTVPACARTLPIATQATSNSFCLLRQSSIPARLKANYRVIHVDVQTKEPFEGIGCSPFMHYIVMHSGKSSYRHTAMCCRMPGFWMLGLPYAVAGGVLNCWGSVLDINIGPLGVSQACTILFALSVHSAAVAA